VTSTEEKAERPDEPAVHPVDEVLPAPRLIVLGLQHLFIMYAGAVAVPLIVGPAVGLDSSDIAILVSADLLVSASPRSSKRSASARSWVCACRWSPGRRSPCSTR
jgi:permease family protein